MESVSELVGPIIEDSVGQLDDFGLKGAGQMQAVIGQIMGKAVKSLKDAKVSNSTDVNKTLKKAMGGAMSGMKGAGIESGSMVHVLDDVMVAAVSNLDEIGITNVNDIKLITSELSSTSIQYFDDFDIKEPAAIAAAAKAVCFGAMNALGNMKAKGILDEQAMKDTTKDMSKGAADALYIVAEATGHQDQLASMSTGMAAGMADGLANAGWNVNDFKSMSSVIKEGTTEGLKSGARAIDISILTAVESQVDTGLLDFIRFMKQDCSTSNGLWHDDFGGWCEYPDIYRPKSGGGFPDPQIAEEAACFEKGGFMVPPVTSDGQWKCDIPIIIDDSGMDPNFWVKKCAENGEVFGTNPFGNPMCLPPVYADGCFAANSLDQCNALGSMCTWRLPGNCVERDTVVPPVTEYDCLLIPDLCNPNDPVLPPPPPPPIFVEKPYRFRVAALGAPIAPVLFSAGMPSGAHMTYHCALFGPPMIYDVNIQYSGIQAGMTALPPAPNGCDVDGFHFNPINGELSGTPQLLNHYIFTVVMFDGFQMSMPQDVEIVVEDSDYRLTTIAPIANQTVQSGTAIVVDINLTDGGDFLSTGEPAFYDCFYDTIIDGQISYNAMPCDTISGVIFDHISGLLTFTNSAAMTAGFYEFTALFMNPRLYMPIEEHFIVQFQSTGSNTGSGSSGGSAAPNIPAPYGITGYIGDIMTVPLVDATTGTNVDADGDLISYNCVFTSTNTHPSPTPCSVIGAVIVNGYLQWQSNLGNDTIFTVDATDGSYTIVVPFVITTVGGSTGQFDPQSPPTTTAGSFISFNLLYNNQPITTVSSLDFSGSGGLQCHWDQTVDGSAMNGSDCYTLPGLITFDPYQGVLNFTPPSPGVFEITIMGTNIYSSQLFTGTFVFQVQ